jgi:hypothetical protein
MTDSLLAILGCLPRFQELAAASGPVVHTPAAAPATPDLPITDSLLIGAVAILSLATCISVVTALYLYRWRRIMLSRPHLLSPEHLASHLLSLEARMAMSEQVLSERTGRLETAHGAVVDALERMIETHMALQPKLDEKDREIQQLRIGYEASQLKRFIRRFIRVDVSVQDRLRNQDIGPADLQAIGSLMEDALAECGVERFAPEVGADYRHAEGVGDDPDRVQTDNQGQAFRIASIRRPGYRFVEGVGDRVVVPAQVSVFDCSAADGPKETYTYGSPDRD